MGIHRLNHAVLYVRDVDEERRVLPRRPRLHARRRASPARPSCRRRARPTTTTSGCSRSASRPQRARPAAGAVGLYHLAWEVETLDDLEDHLHRLAAADALVGMSDHGTTKSLYAKDPDGIEFEVVWLIPSHLLEGNEAEDIRPKPLDLAKEKARYGGSTRGGIGISIPVGVAAG